jgi:hypothetical protein
MVKEREFTGPKVIRIICQDHVILDLSFFSIAPTVSKPRVGENLITLRFDDDSLVPDH